MCRGGRSPLETLWELVEEQGLLVHIVRPVVGVLARNGGDHEQREREIDHFAFLLKHDACLLKSGGASARRQLSDTNDDFASISFDVRIAANNEELRFTKKDVFRGTRYVLSMPSINFTQLHRLKYC